MEMYVVFVDLIKAFDTANREVLWEILEIYRVPRPLIDVIICLHKDYQLEFKLISKNKCTVENTIGVRQEDNMAGILFINLIQAVAELWKKVG